MSSSSGGEEIGAAGRRSARRPRRTSPRSARPPRPRRGGWRACMPARRRARRASLGGRADVGFVGGHARESTADGRPTRSLTRNYLCDRVSMAAPKELEPMPAVVVDDITVLPRIPTPDPAIARERAVRSVTNAPQRLRRGGVPGPPRLRRRRPRGPRPLRPPRPDGRGRIRARRGQGHAVAPASRLRDRHLHDRRHVRAPGLERRRRRSSRTATRSG